MFGVLRTFDSMGDVLEKIDTHFVRVTLSPENFVSETLKYHKF